MQTNSSKNTYQDLLSDLLKSVLVAQTLELATHSNEISVVTLEASLLLHHAGDLL
jgi:hypothetical protein